MALTREFLRSKGYSEADIEEIMKENGKSIVKETQKLSEASKAAQAELDKLKADLEQASGELESYKKASLTAEEIKQKAEQEAAEAAKLKAEETQKAVQKMLSDAAILKSQQVALKVLNTAGIEIDEENDAHSQILSGIVSEDLEATTARATAYAKVFSEQLTAKTEELKKAAIATPGLPVGTPAPLISQDIQKKVADGEISPLEYITAVRVAAESQEG